MTLPRRARPGSPIVAELPDVPERPYASGVRGSVDNACRSSRSISAGTATLRYAPGAMPSSSLGLPFNTIHTTMFARSIASVPRSAGVPVCTTPPSIHSRSSGMTGPSLSNALAISPPPGSTDATSERGLTSPPTLGMTTRAGTMRPCLHGSRAIMPMSVKKLATAPIIGATSSGTA